MGFIPSSSKACWTPRGDCLFCQTMWALGQLCAWIHLHLPGPLSYEQSEAMSVILLICVFPRFPFSEGHRSVNNGKTEQHMEMSLLLSLKVWASCPTPLPPCAWTLWPVAKQTLIKRTVFDP
uniref:Uncharacterized protein n=1 Tax=Myotis myotis TaxID=51298 RepID=A0A7J7XZF1_MYOMY|nr:hypothetical protein mMyoMyo1_011317 [Myotis myotis]